jgi:carboxypeptidase T
MRSQSGVRPGRHLTALAAVLTTGVMLIASAPAAAQPAHDTAEPDHPMLYQVIGAETVDDVDAIARTGAAIEEITDGKVYVTALSTTADEIRALGFDLASLPSPEIHGHAHPEDFPPGYSGYHNYDELLDAIDDIVADHPGIIERYSFGSSYEGRDLVVVKISDNVHAEEGEPEVLFNHGQHAREHLTVEMALYLMNLFTDGYGSDPRVTNLVNNRVIWIMPNVNPDGSEYDIATGSFRTWRKNRQPNPGSSYVGTDLNRNWGHQWGGGGASSNPGAETYRGSAPFSAVETAQMRDFVNSRVINGEQMIKANIDFHTYSELVLWPYGYTYSDTAPGLDADAHNTFRTIGQEMASTNGYTPMQASDLYITSGGAMDWLWYDHGIFAYAFEMYPSSYGGGGFYPPDSVIARETSRNREAVLRLIEYADCPWRAIGKQEQYCGDGGGGGDEQTVWADDFESSTGWTRDSYGNDTATSGVWERGNPQATSYSGTALQLNNTPSGSYALITGPLAGSDPGSYDVDNGVTSIQSPPISLPSSGQLTLSFSWYLAHLNNSSAADYFRVRIVHAGGTTTVLQQNGAASNRAASWTTSQVDLTPYAGQSVQILIEAADVSSSSLVEAAVDDVEITVAGNSFGTS